MILRRGLHPPLARLAALPDVEDPEQHEGDGDGSAWRFVACGDLPLAVLTAS